MDQGLDALHPSIKRKCPKGVVKYSSACFMQLTHRQPASRTRHRNVWRFSQFISLGSSGRNLTAQLRPSVQSSTFLGKPNVRSSVLTEWLTPRLPDASRGFLRPAGCSAGLVAHDRVRHCRLEQRARRDGAYWRWGTSLPPSKNTGNRVGQEKGQWVVRLATMAVVCAHGYGRWRGPSPSVMSPLADSPSSSSRTIASAIRTTISASPSRALDTAVDVQEIVQRTASLSLPSREPVVCPQIAPRPGHATTSGTARSFGVDQGHNGK